MTESSSPAVPFYADGAKEFRNGNYETAVAHFRKAVDLDDSFFRAFAYLGMTYDKMGKIDEAIEAYRECIELAPDYHKAFNNVGELYRRKGLLDYASMVFKMATEIAPTNAIYFYNLGITYSDIGMLRHAEEALTRAFELEPEYLPTVTELARIRFGLGKYDEALKALESFLLEVPDHDRVSEIRARVNVLKRKSEEVREKGDGEAPVDDTTRQIPLADPGAEG
ncbi:MAG: tetratricopeptide repeat protein [Planctomycetota bacterium]|jgi:tetratricopeptide (TPR) repeat protein